MRHAPLVALITVVAAPGAAAQEGVLLRYAPSVGQVSVHRTVVQTDMQLGDAAPVSMEQRMWMTERVTAAEGGVVTLAMTTDSVRMTGSPGMPGATVGGRLAGITSTARIDARGRVVGMAFGDSALQAAAGGMFGQFGAGPSPFLFPAARVMPGETWSDSGTVTTETPQGRMVMFHDVTYRLERLEARGRSRVAVLGITGSFRQRMEMEMGGRTVQMQLEGAVTGETAFDLDASRWVTSEMIMTMVGENAMLGAPMRMTVTSRRALVPG